MNRNSRPLKMTGSEYRERRRGKRGVIKRRRFDHEAKGATKDGKLHLGQLAGELKRLPRWLRTKLLKEEANK